MSAKRKTFPTKFSVDRDDDDDGDDEVDCENFQTDDRKSTCESDRSDDDERDDVNYIEAVSTDSESGGGASGRRCDRRSGYNDKGRLPFVEHPSFAGIGVGLFDTAATFWSGLVRRGSSSDGAKHVVDDSETTTTTMTTKKPDVVLGGRRSTSTKRSPDGVDDDDDAGSPKMRKNDDARRFSRFDDRVDDDDANEEDDENVDDDDDEYDEVVQSRDSVQNYDVTSITARHNHDDDDDIFNRDVRFKHGIVDNRDASVDDDVIVPMSFDGDVRNKNNNNNIIISSITPMICSAPLKIKPKIIGSIGCEGDVAFQLNKPEEQLMSGLMDAIRSASTVEEKQTRLNDMIAELQWIKDSLDHQGRNVEVVRVCFLFKLILSLTV